MCYAPSTAMHYLLHTHDYQCHTRLQRAPMQCPAAALCIIGPHPYAQHPVSMHPPQGMRHTHVIVACSCMAMLLLAAKIHRTMLHRGPCKLFCAAATAAVACCAWCSTRALLAAPTCAYLSSQPAQDIVLCMVQHKNLAGSTQMRLQYSPSQLQPVVPLAPPTDSPAAYSASAAHMVSN
jgi:hypothetical protein